MPAEPTQAKLKRKASRRDTEDYKFEGIHARELESKRNKGEVSCAECRRLKIKCDKQIPCQSCQRRGCAALCPNGSLATGQGTRFVLAATEHLHKKISKLSERIRALEDALGTVHAQTSRETHPLLTEDQIAAEDMFQGDENDYVDESAKPTAHGDVIDAFGTLSISDHGVSRFFGPTGGVESLLASISPTLLSPSASSESSPRGSMSPPTALSHDDLNLFSQSFPFTPVGRTDDIKHLVQSHLPPFDRTKSLCQSYFVQAGWLFRGVTREQLMDDMLPAIYSQSPAHTSVDQSQPNDYGGPHDLALLFIILGIGSLLEQRLEDITPKSLEAALALAEHFRQISRAALSLQPILEKPSIVTIQTLHLMSIYNALSGGDLSDETSMEMTWSLITLAAHLSQTIGLHRDSERWGLTAKMVQRRRILFWDLFVADSWQSLNTGRPPSFSLAYIDCNYPQYDNDKDPAALFEIWQFKFAAECVAEVTTRTLTAEAPTYATIMELDRKIRNFPLPDLAADEGDMATAFRICVLEHIKETVLLYLHRSFFAQAIIDQPTNPLKSTYAHSFLASYRSASTILKSVAQQFQMWPNSSARFWTMWTFAFSAAVVFGTVVTRGPRSPLAKEAMKELDKACLLFSKAAELSKRATKALPILTRLREKARFALAAADDESGAMWNLEVDGAVDELSIIAGHTRFISMKSSSSAPQTVIDEPLHESSSYNIRGPDHPWPQQHKQHGYMSGNQSVLQPAPTPTQATYPTGHQSYNAMAYQTTQTTSTPTETFGWPQKSYSQQPRQQTYPASLPVGNGHQYHRQPSHSGYNPAPQPRQTYQNHPHTHATGQTAHTHNAQLAALGLAARDSRLDERWGAFMHESGLLDDNYRR